MYCLKASLAGLAALAAFCTTPCLAAKKYDALPLQAASVTPTPELMAFIAKMRQATDKRRDATDSEIRALFSGKTEIFTGGSTPETFVPKLTGTSGPQAPVLPLAAKALKKFGSDGDDKFKFPAAARLASGLGSFIGDSHLFGHLPDSPSHVCSMPIVTMEPSALAQTAKPGNDNTTWTWAVAAPVKVYAHSNLKGQVVETLPANIALQVGFTPDDLTDPWEIVTPSGKKGFIAGLSVARLYYEGICFSQQPDKSWLVDTIIVRDF